MNSDESEPVIDNHKVIEGQIRELYGRVTYTHKAHEKSAEILASRSSLLKGLQICLSSLTTGGGLLTVVAKGNNLWLDKEGWAIVTAILSALLTMLNVYLKKYDLDKQGNEHRRAANSLWLIREKYLSLIVGVVIKIPSIEELISIRDKLIREQAKINAQSPQTIPKAYLLAQKALKENEDMTFSDEELDRFLPQQLKSSRASSSEKEASE